MKKLVAASLLSVSLCVSQAGSVWAYENRTETAMSVNTDMNKNGIGKWFIKGLEYLGIAAALYDAWDMLFGDDDCDCLYDEPDGTQYDEWSNWSFEERLDAVCDFYYDYNNEQGYEEEMNDLHDWIYNKMGGC